MGGDPALSTRQPAGTTSTMEAAPLGPQVTRVLADAEGLRVRAIVPISPAVKDITATAIFIDFSIELSCVDLSRGLTAKELIEQVSSLFVL